MKFHFPLDKQLTSVVCKFYNLDTGVQAGNVAGYTSTQVGGSGVHTIDVPDVDLAPGLYAVSAVYDGSYDVAAGMTQVTTGMTRGYIYSEIPLTQEELGATVLAAGDIDGYTLEEAMKLALAVLAGRMLGANTPNNVFRAIDDSKDRVSATVDVTGRTSITLDAEG